MKKATLLSIVMLTLLSSCYHIDREEWECGGDPTDTRDLVYRYAMIPTMQYADMILLTYQLKEYVRQTSEEKRDSVNALYFREVQIEELQDVQNNRTYYKMSTHWAIQTQYQLTVYDTDDGVTHIDGMARSDTSHTQHQLTLSQSGNGEWNVDVILTRPADMNHASPFAFLLDSDITRHATTYHIIWHDSPTEGLTFEMTGSASMVSVREPRLTIQYEMSQPFTMYFMSDSPYYPTRQLFGFIGKNRENSYHLTYPMLGRIEMLATDGISGRESKYVVEEEVYWTNQ